MFASKRSQMIFAPTRRRRGGGIVATCVFWLLWIVLTLISPLASGASVEAEGMTMNENLIVGLVVYALGAALWIISRSGGARPSQVSSISYDLDRASTRL
jgi:hypothetical protein